MGVTVDGFAVGVSAELPVVGQLRVGGLDDPGQSEPHGWFR